MSLKTNVVLKESLYSFKVEDILSIHFQNEFFFGYRSPMRTGK